jgi:hypothetical protein
VWSPISRNVFAPASVHAARDGEHEHQELAAPLGLRGSGTRASTASRLGTFPVPFLIMLVTAVIRACDTVPARAFVVLEALTAVQWSANQASCPKMAGDLKGRRGW